MKCCVTCGVDKEDNDFHKHPLTKDGRQSSCKLCCSIYRKSYAIRNKEQIKLQRSITSKEKTTEQRRKMKYLERYNLSIEQYEDMLKLQNGVCAICLGKPTGKKTRLCVDHCHDTGKVRGLLCNECNVGLGRFRDKVDLLASAIEYLKGAK